MFSGKEQRKDEKEIFTRLKLCRHIPFPFWFHKLKKKIASPPFRNAAPYTSGYKVIVCMYMYVYAHMHMHMLMYMCVYVHMHMLMYMYVHMHMLMYMYV